MTAAGQVDADMMLPLFKALAHDSRLKLLGHLALGECSVQQLAARTGLSEPTTSHHLAMLRAAGLVALRAEGTTRWYRFAPERLRALSRSLLSRERVAALARAATPPGEGGRIVRNYLTPEGRLKTFPAQRGKRWHILCWLARHFEDARRYTEAEVNAILSVRHHDVETCRRELVGHRMLARERGVYWRLPDEGWAKA